MRTLAKYLQNYKKESVLAPFFKFLEVVFDLLVPVVIAQIIDVGIANNDHGYIVQKFFILILMAAAGLAVSITAQFFAAKASVGFATEVRQAVFDHIQKLSYTELDTLGTDTLITRLTDDVNQVQNGVNMGLRLLLRSPFIVLGSMVMAFTINVRCALIFAVAIPVLFLVVFVIMFLSIPLFKKVQGRLDSVTRLTRENLTGVRVIRAFCREADAVAEFDESNLALTRLNEFVGKISALLNPATYVLINIATVILIRTAGVQVNLGNMQQGEIVALYNYMSQILVELIKLANLVINITKALACANRIDGVFAVKSSMADGKLDISETGKNTQVPAVEFKNVCLKYAGGGEEALTDINFSVMPGETVGVIGGTGSGKSSLVNMIARFYDATEGEVKINGRNVKEYNIESLRNHVAVVMQKALLFKGSIRDNMKWGKKDATDDEIMEALDISQSREFVEKKDGKLDAFIDQGGKNLSGGQRQRLTIARAMVRKPDILILDDSASALDFATDAALRKAIRGMKSSPTLFIVSQRAASLMHADKIIVLDDGKVAGIGTHDELLAGCEVYQEIYYSQFKKEAM